MSTAIIIEAFTFVIRLALSSGRIGRATLPLAVGGHAKLGELKR
jgi:hypothetical protein